MDILPAIPIISYIFSEDLTTADATPFNDYFNTGGFGSTQAIPNLASSFLYEVLCIPLIVITLILRRLKSKRYAVSFNCEFSL